MVAGAYRWVELVRSMRDRVESPFSAKDNPPAAITMGGVWVTAADGTVVMVDETFIS